MLENLLYKPNVYCVKTRNAEGVDCKFLVIFGNIPGGLVNIHNFVKFFEKLLESFWRFSPPLQTYINHAYLSHVV